jgi:divalent metal cation (Fe/Co/Zn/Cd) transporter
MKLKPAALFVAILMIGMAVFGFSALLSALGDAASQRSDFGVIALSALGLTVVAALAAYLLHLFQKHTTDSGTSERKKTDERS